MHTTKEKCTPAKEKCEAQNEDGPKEDGSRPPHHYKSREEEEREQDG